MKNLQAEMVRSNLTADDIATAIRKGTRTAADKVRGKFSFTFPEALIIRDAFFPGMRLEYLFATDEPTDKTA